MVARNCVASPSSSFNSWPGILFVIAHLLHPPSFRYIGNTSPMPIVVASHTPRRHSEVVSREDIGLSYLRIVWLEYLSIAVVAASALWVYSLPVYYLEQRLIPIQRSSALGNASEGSVLLFHGPVELSYPLVKEPLPTWACGLVVVFVPLLVVTMFQLKLRSLWDFHAGFTGTLKTAAVS
jgi:hypothetical protein